MQNDEEPWDDGTEIDPEVLLRALLAVTGDKDLNKDIVQKVSAMTGLAPERVELIFSATINYLANKTRSN